MSSRALRVRIVALVAIAVVAVGIVFLVLRRVSESGLVYDGQIPVVDRDEIPVFTAEVSTVSVPIKADYHDLACRIREAATDGKKFPWSLDSDSEKIAESPGRCAVFYYKVDLLSLDITLQENPRLLKQMSGLSGPLLSVKGKIHLYGPVQEKWGGKYICDLGYYSGPFEFTKLYIVGLDESAKLIFHEVAPARVTPLGTTEVDLGFVKFDDVLGCVHNFITPKVAEKVDPVVNKEVNVDYLTPWYDKGWVALHKPIELTGGVWLVFHPEEFEVAQLHGSRTMLETTVTVRGRPKVILGDKPQVPQVPPRPPVRLGRAKGGLHVVVDAIVPLDEAERLLNKELGQLEKFIYDQAKVEVKVPKARIYSCENCLRLELLLTEPFQGSVFLEGAPRYDAEMNELYVEGLDFTVDTKHVLAASASWLLDFPPLVDYLQKKVRLPVGGELATVGKAVCNYDGEEIADGMVLQLGDTSFKMLCVYNTGEDMHFIVQADGSAEVTMN